MSLWQRKQHIFSFFDAWLRTWRYSAPAGLRCFIWSWQNQIKRGNDLTATVAWATCPIRKVVLTGVDPQVPAVVDGRLWSAMNPVVQSSKPRISLHTYRETKSMWRYHTFIVVFARQILYMLVNLSVFVLRNQRARQHVLDYLGI